MILAVAVALTAGVLAFVFLIRPEDLPPAETPPPWAHLEEKRDVLYDNLRDLNFEYGLGKLSDDDYAKAKATLQAELAQVNAELERMQAQAAGKTVKAASAKQPPAPQPAPGTVCPHCGAKFDKPLKFCGECGKPMTGGAA
jgi:hypothetical protein